MRRLVLALLFACLLAPPAAAQSLLSPTEFRDAALAVISTQALDIQLTPRDELGVDIRRPGDKQFADSGVNFDRAYEEYRANPGALTDILDRWARFATQPPEPAQMVERVVSILRTRETVDAYNAAIAQGERPSPLVWRPFAGDLVEVIVFDAAETVQYASVDALQEIGLSPDAAWEAAPRNLPARLGALDVGGVEGADSVAYIAGGNGLAPSSLIDGRICAGDGASYLFLVVDRGAYVMADGADSVAQSQFRQVLDDLRREGGSLSQTPLGCQNGRIVAVTLAD